MEIRRKIKRFLALSLVGVSIFSATLIISPREIVSQISKIRGPAARQYSPMILKDIITKSPWVDVRGFGAKGDGITDDTVAIRSAFTSGRIVFFPEGIYIFSSPLTATNIPLILGVPGKTILKPTAAITTIALSINTSLRSESGYQYPTVVYGIDLYGINTNGVTGIKIGSPGISGDIYLQNVEVYGFMGTGAIGLQVSDVVNFKAERCCFAKNYIAALVSGSRGFPTTVTFDKTNFRQSNSKGLKVVCGWSIITRDCIFEANGEEGLYAVPGGGNSIRNLIVEKGWFEANYYGKSNRENYFNIIADGTNAVTCRIYISDTHFATDLGEPRVFKLTRIDDFVINNPQLASAIGNDMQFATYSYGRITASRLIDGYLKNIALKDSTSVVKIEEDVGVGFFTLSSGDTSPDVSFHTRYKTNNSSSTTITNFSNGYPGQKIVIVFGDGNTHINFTKGYLKGNGGQNWSPKNGDWMDCIFDGNYWYCAVHSSS